MAVIDSISTGVSEEFTELRTLGRTMKRQADDILGHFDHARTSNGPTEAINGRIKHLRGTALGFRNLLHHTTSALLDTGGFRTKIHSFYDEPVKLLKLATAYFAVDTLPDEI